MKNLEELDAGWIKKALLKRGSNYSSVICFETGDPARYQQLREHIKNGGKLADFEVYVFDQWTGLGKLDKGQSEIVPYKAEVSRHASQLDPTTNNLVTDMKEALRQVDPVLKTRKALFIINNIGHLQDRELDLMYAVKSWALDGSVCRTESSVYLFAPGGSAIFDEHIRDFVVDIPVDLSSDVERKKIISDCCEYFELALDADEIEVIARATAGLNLHQLECILRESFFETGTLDLEAIKNYKTDLIRKSKVLEVSSPTRGFEDVGGYQAVKNFIQKNIIDLLKNPGRAKKFALGLPKGILFFGPPGTGKTYVSEALAREVDLPFIRLQTENIYSMFLGESGQRMKSAIKVAESMAPAIVFIDEIDRFGKRTSTVDSAGEETRRVFSQVLEWLGKRDRKTIIVGATNVPEQLDPAFTRAGRLDYKIPLLYPGKKARREILLVHVLKGGPKRIAPPLAMEEGKLIKFLDRKVVPMTVRFSAAELEELVNRAKRHAINRNAEVLEEEDFLAAATTFRIDPEVRKDEERKYLDQAYEKTDDQVFLDEFQE